MIFLAIFEFDKPCSGRDIGKGTFVDFRQLFDVIENLLSRYSLNSVSELLCLYNKGRHYILNVRKNVLNEVQTQYQYWNNFTHIENLLVFLFHTAEMLLQFF